MKIKNILYENEYTCENTEAAESEFEKIASTPGDIGEKTLYFHLKGVNFNTEKLISSVLEKKPSAIVAELDSSITSSDIPILRVKNARCTLAFAYSRFFGIDFSKIKFIGITGTNGKTTTAEMIKEILVAHGHRIGLISTGKIESDGRLLSDFKYSMTTPDPSLLYKSIAKMQSDGCDFVIMEVSSHALALEKTAPIPFEVGVFTNLSHEHMDFHTDLSDYYETKMKLFQNTRLGIFNIDDTFSRRGYEECECEKKSVGILWDADITVKEPQLLGFDGSKFLYRGENFIFKMKLPLVGAYNIYNALCAVSASVALGCRPCLAKRTLENMRAPEGRFEIKKGSVNVIIDYAHTPSAFENVLKTVYSAKKYGQKVICVFGCGGLRDRRKRPQMAKAAEKYCDFIIITEDNSRSEPLERIIDDILKGVSDKSKTAVIRSRKEAIESAVTEAPDDAIIVLLGKGAERYNIDIDGVHPFDEREIVNTAMKKREEINCENKA